MPTRLGNVAPGIKPHSNTANEALSLLIMMGRDKTAAAKLLKQMEEIQKYNEKLLGEANAVVITANRAQRKLDDAQTKLDNDQIKMHEMFEQRDKKLCSWEQRVRESEEIVKQETDELNAEHNRLKAELKAREQTLAENESIYMVADRKLKAREEAVLNGEATNKAVLADLNKRDLRLRKAMEE